MGVATPKAWEAMIAVADTSILIDYLNGVSGAADELARYDSVSISVITWIEVMIGARDAAQQAAVRSFLDTFPLHGVDAAVADRVVSIRRQRRIRVPDAIIEATARERGALLVTRNTKDFPRDDPGVRIPSYRVPPAR